MATGIRNIDMKRCVQIIQAEYGEQLYSIKLPDKQMFYIEVYVDKNRRESTLRPSEKKEEMLILSTRPDCQSAEFDRFTNNDRQLLVLSALSKSYRELFDRCCKYAVVKLRNEEDKRVPGHHHHQDQDLWNRRIVIALREFFRRWLSNFKETKLPFSPCISKSALFDILARIFEVWENMKDISTDDEDYYNFYIDVKFIRSNEEGYLDVSDTMTDVLTEIDKQINEIYKGRGFVSWCSYKLKVNFSDRCKLLFQNTGVGGRYLCTAFIKGYDPEMDHSVTEELLGLSPYNSGICSCVFKCSSKI